MTGRPTPTRQEALTSLRSTLDWLGDDVKRISAPVDPDLEATAINKAFDDGPAFLMETVTGYPNARLIASLWAGAKEFAAFSGSTPCPKRRIVSVMRSPIRHFPKKSPTRRSRKWSSRLKRWIRFVCFRWSGIRNRTEGASSDPGVH